MTGKASVILVAFLAESHSSSSFSSSAMNSPSPPQPGCFRVTDQFPDLGILVSPNDDESNPHSLNKYGGLSSSQSLLAVECSFVSSLVSKGCVKWIHATSLRVVARLVAGVGDGGGGGGGLTGSSVVVASVGRDEVVKMLPERELRRK